MPKNEFQIVIPMTGIGSRFIAAGYTTPKPLIKVDNKTMIEYVIDLFPDETNFIFIVNSGHAETTNILEVLNRAAPSGRVVLAPKGKGPVDAVMEAQEYIKDDLPTIVNYCDFNMRWDYRKFKDEMLTGNYHGGIPCYKGFHPHLLHENNLYASCRVNDQLELLEIREKYSFTQRTMDSFQSVGTYYHRTGRELKHYYNKLLNSGNTLNGEYYSSIVFEEMLKDENRIKVFEVDQFCQRGTPNDLDEFVSWIEAVDNDSITRENRQTDDERRTYDYREEYRKYTTSDALSQTTT